MNNPQKSAPKKDATQIPDIRIAFARYIYHWPLFVLALLIAFAAGWFYIQAANPVYEINASILVKDEKKSPQEKSAVQELDQTGSPNNAETEMQILTSKRLITQVVNDLQLWVSYTAQHNLKEIDLYDTAPFKFQISQRSGQLLKKTEIDILIKNEDSFEVQYPGAQTSAGRFNEEISGPFGKWKLVPTALLSQYAGKVITITVNDPGIVANEYLKSLDVHLLDKLAPTIGLFITDKVQKRGKDVLNFLIKDYNETTSAEEKRKTASTISFLEQRLSSLKTELDQAEKQVEGFRSSEGITDIGSQSKVYLENVQANDSKLNDVNVQLNVIKGIEHYVNNANPETAPAISGIENETLSALVKNLSDLQQKHVALLATTPETNPMFEPLNRQISNTKASIKMSLQGLKSSLQNTKSELQSFNNKFDSSIRNIPGQERQFIDMKRQQSIKENLYIYLLQKKEELELSNASTLVDARIVDNANLGDMQWPRPLLIYTIALILGLGVPFIILYFRGSFNNNILEVKEIQQSVEIPVLATISQTNMKKDSIVRSDMRNIINEQFRALRINLDHLYKTRARTVATTRKSLIGEVFPMYVINGVKSDISAYNSLLSSDIKNICFLKDDSYVSRYGDSARHGVVEVTTHEQQGEHVFAPLIMLEEPAKYAVSSNKNVLKNGSMNIDRPAGRVTLVTSSISNEGKSFIVSNLAVSIAAVKRKTALLDMNLHKAKISDIFKLQPSHSGLTDFLASDMDTDLIIQKLPGIPNLDIITCGNLDEQSVELLEQGRLSILIDTLKESYDEILIDSPPLHLVTDAMIIADLADVTLYVIRQDYTDKNELDFVRQVHEEQKLPEMNIVFNGIAEEKYGYSHDKSYYNYRSPETGMVKLLRSIKNRL